MTCATPLLLKASPGGIPDTPAGQLMKLWLEAFNSGERERLVEFRARYAPDQPDHIEQMWQTRRFTGGMEFRRIEAAGEKSLKAIVKERDGDTHALLEVEAVAAEPLRAGKITMQRMETPADLRPARLGDAELVRALEERAEDLAKRGEFAGAVLLARGGEVLLDKAYGWADREAKTANTTKAQFRIGSMGKMFTAVATLQLVEKGKIDLQAPLGEYLKDYPNQNVARKVTIRHLLNHTGGTGDIFGPEYARKRLELQTHADYVKLYGARELAFEPGSKWEYSNYGFVLLGVVIEKVTGRSYYEQVKETIYGPAGMTGTDALPENVEVPGRTKGYMRGAGGWVLNTDTLPWRGTAAGGGYSTTRDLWRFAQALEGGKLLGAALRREATVASKPGERYGYGFQMSEKPARLYGHGGGAPGMNGDLRVLPESGVVMAVLANLDPPAAGRLTGFVMERLKV